MARLVNSKQTTSPVNNQAPGWGYRLEPDPIPVRLGEKLIVVANLQVVVTIGQQDQSAENNGAGENDTLPIDRNFTMGVPQYITRSKHQLTSVVGMIGINRPRPINLLGEHYAHKWVGQCNPAE